MNKTILGIAVAVVAVAAVAGIVIAQNNNSRSDMSTMSEMNSKETEQDNNPFTNPSKDQSTDQVQTGEVKMDIEGFAFAQKTLKVKKGTKVTWTNKDSARHDISPDEESANFKPSELLAQGESYSYTFETPGTYAYHCTPHPYMKASIEVVE